MSNPIRFAITAVMMTAAFSANAQNAPPIPVAGGDEQAQEWYVARLASNTTLVGRRDTNYDVVNQQIDPTWVIGGIWIDGDPSCVSAEGHLDIVWVNGDRRSLSFMTVDDENAASTSATAIPLPIPGWIFVGQPAVSHVYPGRTEIFVELFVDNRSCDPCESKLMHGVKLGHASDPSPVTWTEWPVPEESTLYTGQLAAMGTRVSWVSVYGEYNYTRIASDGMHSDSVTNLGVPEPGPHGGSTTFRGPVADGVGQPFQRFSILTGADRQPWISTTETPGARWFSLGTFYLPEPVSLVGNLAATSYTGPLISVPNPPNPPTLDPADLRHWGMLSGDPQSPTYYDVFFQYHAPFGSSVIQRTPPSLAVMNPRSVALCVGPKLGPQPKHPAVPATTTLSLIGGAVMLLVAGVIITTRQRLRDLAAMAAFLGGCSSAAHSQALPVADPIEAGDDVDAPAPEDAAIVSCTDDGPRSDGASARDLWWAEEDRIGVGKMRRSSGTGKRNEADECPVDGWNVKVGLNGCAMACGGSDGTSTTLTFDGGTNEAGMQITISNRYPGLLIDDTQLCIPVLCKQPYTQGLGPSSGILAIPYHCGDDPISCACLPPDVCGPGKCTGVANGVVTCACPKL